MVFLIVLMVIFSQSTTDLVTMMLICVVAGAKLKDFCNNLIIVILES